ncbi:unnamed protein product [Pleuronectes platessa]|uniref:Uncharacterized protein n=1 Tax=Pleuronectes platessa TaxID=8262 RepID=A0A9N7TQ59_PLEPL|nr:unnamed protein product [Pleuronectes platessa]
MDRRGGCGGKPPSGESQRRVTFHLPDGSQESCSDSGLGDHEPVGSGSLLTQPLPLVQAQDDFYEQASPDKRTEADGNSDPNSVVLLSLPPHGFSFTSFLDPLRPEELCVFTVSIVKRQSVTERLLNVNEL